MKYVMINQTTQEITQISDPVTAYNEKTYDPRRDRIYQLGNEVIVKVVVETLPNKRSATGVTV